MSATAELNPASKESETKRPSGVSSKPPQEVAGDGNGAFLSRALGGAAGESPADGAAKLLRNPALSHPANSGVRAIAFKRAQQTQGNHFAQRVIDGIQRKPAVSGGGTPLSVQRMPENGGGGETTGSLAPTQPEEENSAHTLIVEDDAVQRAPGQMTKSAFLSEAHTAVCEAAEPILSRAGRTTDDCPYLSLVFTYLNRRDASYVESTLRRFSPDLRNASSASAFIPAIVERVRKSTQHWVDTGEITGLPEGIPTVFLAAAGRNGGATSTFNGGLQAKGESGGARLDHSPESIRQELGEGRALESNVATRMGGAFGQDFSHVRVHTDATAGRLSSDLSARAFTVGDSVAFGDGEYQPGTPVGDALIAHELAHVIQQSGAVASGIMQKGEEEAGVLEEDADMSALGAVANIWGGVKNGLAGVATSAIPSLRSGLRLQRCGPEVPSQTVNWEDVNREEYEASVKKIRDLHEQEKTLLAEAGWDDKRAGQLDKIQSDIATEVQNLQKMGIRRDAPDILKRTLQAVPEDLRQVTGKLEGGETPIYWGEKRQFKLTLDYLPKDVDYYVWWAFNPGTQKQGIFATRTLVKDLTVSLDEEFWAYWNKYGAEDNATAGEAPGFRMVADLFLGGGEDRPDKSFTTDWISLSEDKVPTSISINAPRIISMPDPSATAQPGKPPPTSDYVLQNADIEFNLSWDVPVPGARNPKYGIQWYLTDPTNITRYRGDSKANEWKVSYNFPDTGKHTVGAEIYPLSKWASDPDVEPVATAKRELQSISHEQLGGLALTQTKKDVPNIEYAGYVRDLDKQIGDIEKTQRAGSAQGEQLAQRLEDLKEQREKVLDQVGAVATLPFPEKEADFSDKTTYVSSIPAVLSTPEYGGAFPLTVFITMKKTGNSWDARITDTTTQDVSHWGGSAATPRAALEEAISDWHGSNEYPENGSLHYSFGRYGWNLSGNFGLGTFKKSFWKWFDRILFVAQAIVALVLLLAPEPTGATKAAGIALLSIGILRSAYNIYNNLSLGRPVLDQRNVLEAISMVTAVVGIKGGAMMGAAGKSVAAGEALAGKALTTFRVGQGLVIMGGSADIGTFVYVAADAISQLQAAENDPSIPAAQRERHVMETYLRLFSQGLLILGTNAHLFQGAKPKGTNLGMFLDKVAGADATINLDPSMRIRLQSEFRKMNAEVDVTTLTDRELVMGLQIERVRSKLLKRPEIHALLKKKPELRTGLEQNPKLIDLMANDDTVRNVLVKRPEVLESLLKHPDAIDIVERAVAQVAAAKGKGGVPSAQELTTPLSTGQLDVSNRISEAVPKGKSTQSGFDATRIGDASYTEHYLDNLYKQAEVAQVELTTITEGVAAATKGEAASRLEPKLRQRAIDKINSDYGGDASQLNDLAGSKIVYQTLDDLYLGLEKAEKELGGKIVYFNDRFIKPMASGYRDVQMNVKMSNGHVAEFRLHLASIEAVAKAEHAAYELRRAIKPVAKEAGRATTPAEEALEQALIAESQQLYGEALAKGLKTP